MFKILRAPFRDLHRSDFNFNRYVFPQVVMAWLVSSHHGPIVLYAPKLPGSGQGIIFLSLLCLRWVILPLFLLKRSHCCGPPNMRHLELYSWHGKELRVAIFPMKSMKWGAKELPCVSQPNDEWIHYYIILLHNIRWNPHYKISH